MNCLMARIGERIKCNILYIVTVVGEGEKDAYGCDKGMVKERESALLSVLTVLDEVMGC